MNNSQMDIGRRIKERRIELDLTQEELGQRLGIKKSAVCRLESEEADNFSIGRIIKIAQALDTTPGYLTGWTDASSGSPLVDSLDYSKAELINFFSELDEVGKDKLLTYAKDMYFIAKTNKESRNSEA